MADELGAFRTKVHEDADPPVAMFSGELDLAAADCAWQALEPLIVPGRGGLIVDLEEVTFIDSRGLNVLVHALRVLHGDALVLRNTPERIIRLLDIVGITDRVVLS